MAEHTGIRSFFIVPSNLSQDGDYKLNEYILLQSLPGLDRILGTLKELLLQARAHLIRLDCANCFCDALRPGLHVELAQLFRRRRAVASVVIGKFRVPPDPCVDGLRQIEALRSAPDSSPERS